MKKILLGKSSISVPAIAVGCMHMSQISDADADRYVHACVERGANYFDHADIYGRGASEEIFGRVLANDPSLRHKITLQSKCGIVSGIMYDSSKEHIIEAVNGSLKRLNTDYLDVLLIHRPDALMEPDEMAEAFDELKEDGKVLNFGVSNMNSMQMELISRAIHQPLLADQLQFSVPVSNMVSQGMEVNMTSNGASMRDGSVLDYCRLNKITIQAWSPFQKPNWGGPFIGAEDYKPLNDALTKIGEKYGLTPTGMAAAWILRHPANMQVIMGTMRLSRMEEIIAASDTEITREEWYKIYLSAGHILP